MSNQRYKQTFFLLNRIGKSNDKELRAELCYSVSQGRTESLSELSDMEIIEINQHLKRIAADVTPSIDELKLKRMHRKFFSVCYDLRWTAKGKLDYTTIFNWVNKYGYLKKEFNKYTVTELPGLITQLQKIQRHSYEKD